MSKISNTQERIIISCYKKLLKCIQPTNLDNTELICSNISKIKDMKPFLPQNIYASFMQAIDRYIDPIINDNDKFLSSLHTPDIGFINDDGHFEIKGERELALFFARLYQLSINVEKDIEAWACSELSPYFG